MASNINVGMGIGLQGKLTAPDRVFAADQAEKQYQRKLNIAAQKEKDDELEAIKKKILLEKPKIHRLLASDVSTKTAEALKGMVMAKQQNPNDYLTNVYDIWGNLQSTLNEATSKSAMLNQFEKDMTSTTGKEYVSSSVKAAYDLMNKSNNLDEWYANMSTKGVPNSNFFSYSPEVKAFNYAIVPKVDPNFYAKTSANQHAKNPITVDDVKVNIGGKEVMDRRISFGTVETKEEAEKIYQKNIKDARGDVNKAIRPVSDYEIAESYFQNPGALEQYIDLHPGVNETNAVDHFVKNYSIPNKKNSQMYMLKGPGSQFNITQNVGGGEEKATLFKYSEEPKTYAMAGKENVTSVGNMALAKSELKFKSSESKEYARFSTGEFEPGKVGNVDMMVNEITLLPVEVDSNGNILKITDPKTKTQKLNILGEEEAKKLVASGKKVSYKRFAFVQDISKLKNDLMNKQLIVPYEVIESNVMQNIETTKSSPARKEFEAEMKKMKTAAIQKTRELAVRK